MGKLGGGAFVFLVIIGLMVAGGYWILDGIKRFFNRGKRAASTHEKMGLLMTQLKQEGFFEPSAEPVIIQNRALSEALSESSKEEGFFWGISKRNIFIKENPMTDRYDTLLVFGNRAIGFNWRGQL
jgi:hypothetical protein